MQSREAINEILININELPLDDDDIITDINIAIVANTFLEIARKQVLSYGWNFNSLDMDLFPNTSGYIVIPKTYLSVDADEMAVRDWKLWDVLNQTFLFEDLVTCQVVEDIVFDDLPYHVANYAVKVASAMTYANVIGDTNGMQMRQSLVTEAKVEAFRDEANKIDGNVLDNEYATTLLNKTSI